MEAFCALSSSRGLKLGKGVLALRPDHFSMFPFYFPSEPSHLAVRTDSSQNFGSRS